MSAITPAAGEGSPVAGAGCGHGRRQHCACQPCLAACSQRQAEDLIPIMWPVPREMKAPRQ